MDSDQAVSSLRDVSMAIQDIASMLKQYFQYNITNNVHRVSDMNGWVADETLSPPTITFTVSGRYAIDIFLKMETKYPNSIRLSRRTSTTKGQNTAEYLVGDYSAFMQAYNDTFLWYKFSKEFETALEEELSKKPE